jgi:membrane-bound lytic murein transglycosylase D
MLRHKVAPQRVKTLHKMKFINPVFTAIGYVSLFVALTLGGCSKDTVKSPSNINDSQLESKANTPPKKLAKGSQYDTLWDRLFALYALPHVENSDIDREINWFANHPGYIERAQSRAEPFLFSIVKLIEKQDVPGEIALLPIVESAFQPHVVSPARAAGIWQFIPSTGTHFGLKRSSGYDGRRDVYASTKAAIKYLKKLHNDFGDWLLAVAAYNCGEGNVAKAIRRNEASGLPTDFWSLNLPQETRAYVPRLLAIARIFADSEKYGINLKEMPNTAQFKPVKVSTQLDLALAAEAAGITLERLKELNPGFKGQYADVEGSYHLFIPAHKKAAEFRQEVERLSQEKGLGTTTLSEGVPEPGSFESFRRELPKQSVAEYTDSSSDSAQSSSRSSGRDDSYKHSKSASSREDAGQERTSSYLVLRGETLYSVARKHSMDVSSLAQLNKLRANTEIQAGQKLIVSAQETSRAYSSKGASSKSYKGHHASSHSDHAAKLEKTSKQSGGKKVDSVKNTTTHKDTGQSSKSQKGKVKNKK